MGFGAVPCFAFAFVNSLRLDKRQSLEEESKAGKSLLVIPLKMAGLVCLVFLSICLLSAGSTGSGPAARSNPAALLATMPTPFPSSPPTITPTVSPSAAPSTFNEAFELFAVIGGGECAESLHYGPVPLTVNGSDGFAYYLSTATAFGQIGHRDWLQIVTDGSLQEEELFRIYWTFATDRTLAQRFSTAPTAPQTVSYRVVDTAGVAGSAGREYGFSGTWAFSSSATITMSKFTVARTSASFSADDGAWGAGNGLIDGNAPVTGQFWGQGNFDSSDAASCGNIYAKGTVVRSSSTSKSFMYLRKGVLFPTLSPSVRPSFRPSMRPSAAPVAIPTPAPTELMYMMKINQQIILSNVALTARAQDAIVRTIATVLSVDRKRVSITGSNATTTLLISTQTIADMRDYPTLRNNITAVFSLLASRLAASVISSDTFTRSLRQYGLTNAHADSAVSTYAGSYNNPASSSTEASSSSPWWESLEVILFIAAGIALALASWAIIVAHKDTWCRKADTRRGSIVVVLPDLVVSLDEGVEVELVV